MAKARFNQHIIIGNLGRDPEITYTPSGLGIAKLNVATNDGYYSSKKQEWVDRTTWHNCEMMAKKDIESVGGLRKGDSVLIIGSKNTDSWEGRDGQRQYRDKIKISVVAKVISIDDLEKETPRNPAPDYGSGPDDDIPF